MICPECGEHHEHEYDELFVYGECEKCLENRPEESNNE